jgi:hypothetical protein
MTVQQTASAIATRGTRLIGVVEGTADSRDLATHGIEWTLSSGDRWSSPADALPST